MSNCRDVAKATRTAESKEMEMRCSYLALRTPHTYSPHGTNRHCALCDEKDLMSNNTTVSGVMQPMQDRRCRRTAEIFRIPEVFFAVDGRSRRFYGCLAPHTLSDLLPTTANFSDDDLLSN